MMMRSITIGAVLALAACGEPPLERNLVVDGPRDAKFASDKSQCFQLAENYSDGSPASAAQTGALLGGIFGALDADEGEVVGTAVAGAAAGGLISSLGASGDLDVERRAVLIRCMQNRGHNVIG